MSKVEKIKAYLERRIAEIRDISQGYIADKQMSTEYLLLHELLSFIDSLEEEPVSNDLEEAAHSYVDTTIEHFDSEGNPCCYPAFIAGAQWQKANLWKDAQSDDLPEIDREVIALLSNGKVVYAHRPQEYWDGKNITTGEVTRHYPVRHDKGGWNIPDVKFWLDCELFEIEE